MSSNQTAPTAAPPGPAEPTGPIVARAGTYYRRTRYILAFVMIAYAAWSCRDGFYAWPLANQQWADQHPFDKPIHNYPDILLNKILGVTLPILAVAMIAWMLRRSRGEYRLDANTLHIPGHPPIPLSEIESVDRSKWDRKGIAIVTYHLSSGKPAIFRMDDFLYEQTPADQIFKQIEAALLIPKAPKAPPPPKVAAIPAPPRQTRIPPRPRMGA